MGTWIEIPVLLTYSPIDESFPAMGTWIEISTTLSMAPPVGSFPAMGTWIEMQESTEGNEELQVVPCNGNVD